MDVGKGAGFGALDSMIFTGGRRKRNDSANCVGIQAVVSKETQQEQVQNNLITSPFGCFCELGVLVVGAFVISALQFGVYSRAPDFWKLPFADASAAGREMLVSPQVATSHKQWKQ